jgi:stage II sporulation protein M
MIGVISSILSFIGGFFFEGFIIEHAQNIANGTGIQENVDPTNIQKFLSTSINNILLSFIIIMSGFIPIYGVPLIFGIISFVAVGILVSYGFMMEKDVIKTLLVAFFPHAIIEVIPIVYSATIGMYLNNFIVKKLYHRKKANQKLKTVCYQCLQSYLLIIIPFFILAAIVESFITTFLIDKFN